MGHCFSCFKDQGNANHLASAPVKKDEMTEIMPSNQASSGSILCCDPPEEPLLNETDRSLNGNKRYSLYASHSIQEPCLAVDTTHAPKQILNEKTKTFYQKLPSLPRSVSSLTSSEARVSEAKLNQLFDTYKDSTEDFILAEGIENLCNDLQLSPDEFKVLVLAWKLNAGQMCRFTKSEFVQGLKSMKTDSIKGIQNKLTEITNELQRDPDQFKDLYRFTFKFGLDVSVGQRILPADVAIVLWRLVFTYNQPSILARWLNYLERNPHIRGIPKDTWYMFLNFCEYIGDDLSSYDDTEAWPSLFDDFVEYENDQMNQNITKNDIKMQN